jgi:hypothetical protein
MGHVKEDRVEKVYRYTIDSIDDAGCAVLEREDKLTFPVPVHWLPEGAEPSDRLRATIEASEKGLAILLTVEESPGRG